MERKRVAVKDWLTLMAAAVVAITQLYTKGTHSVHIALK